MQIFAISGIINALVSIGLGLVVILKNWRLKSNLIFFLMTISLFVWGFGYWQWQLASDYSSALFWVRILSIGSLFIPIFFFHWVAILLNKQRQVRLIVYLSYLAGIIISLFFSSNFFIPSVEQKLFFPYWPNAGLIYSAYFFLIYIGLISFSLYFLFKSYRTEKDRNKKGQILYVIIGALLGFVGGLTNFFLWFNIPIPPYGTFLVSVFPFLLGYSILKNKLFDVKTIATEILVFAISIILIIEIIFSTSLTLIILRSIFLVIVVIFGYLLVKSVYREVDQREKIEKLAVNLEKTNANLEVANDKLKELDKQKTEFVSIASHQLRSPLTAIIGYSSMLLEGSFGELTDQARDKIGVIYESSRKQAGVIEDFLNITRIELGKMKYEMSVVDLGKMVEQAVNELKPNISRRGIGITFSDHEGPYNVSADPLKLNQVFLNIIDNAVKYTERGSIAVIISRRPEGDKSFIRFTCRDTGVGISPTVLPKLFEKFLRADDAGQTSISGTGLGLYVAKQIVVAHSGKIWAESAGKGHGSTFVVELAEKKGIS